MLHKCANPACATLFRRLGEGKLFQVEAPYLAGAEMSARKRLLSRRIEHFWLCDPCASHLTLSFEKGRGVVTVPMPGRAMRDALTAICAGGAPAVRQTSALWPGNAQDAGR